MNASTPETESTEDERLTPCGLTPAQETAWADTMSLMTWTCPGFRHLFYKLLTNHNGSTAAMPVKSKLVPVAATDAKNILINPDTYFKYDLRQRVFIAAHEVMHNVYMDVPFLHRCQASGQVPLDDGTTKPFDNKVMQHAMDYRINALLKESKIGSPPKDCLLDDKIATANTGLTEVYKKLYEDYEQNGQLGGQGFDTVLAPGQSTGQNPSQAMPNPQQWAVEVKAAQTLEAMKAQGKMPGALQRMFEQVLNPQVPWTDHIRGIFNRKVGSGNWNWRRPDRRFITRDLYMPSRSGNGAGHVVVWGDTSGSIGDNELCHYMAELSNIIDDCQPKRLTILWCDAAIHRVDEIEEASDMARLRYDAQTEGVGGGGGTSVHPCFEWIKENCDEPPEVFIAFTDGYVSFPEQEPPFLSIWCMTTDVEAPWGDHVRINPSRG